MGRQLQRVGALSAALLLLAGCGGRVMPNQTLLSNTTTQTSNTASAYTAPVAQTNPYGAATTSPYATNNPYTTGNGAADPYGSTGYGTAPAANLSPLTATIENKKNGKILGLGKYQVTVKISNPASVPQSGTLQVTILSSGKSIKEFTEQVTLQPGQSETRTYEDSRWKADDATVTLAPVASNNYYY